MKVEKWKCLEGRLVEIAVAKALSLVEVSLHGILAKLFPELRWAQPDTA